MDVSWVEFLFIFLIFLLFPFFFGGDWISFSVTRICCYFALIDGEVEQFPFFSFWRSLKHFLLEMLEFSLLIFSFSPFGRIWCRLCYERWAFVVEGTQVVGIVQNELLPLELELLNTKWDNVKSIYHTSRIYTVCRMVYKVWIIWRPWIFSFCCFRNSDCWQ